MAREFSSVAADTKLETPEGPLTMATIARAPVSVMTRNDQGVVRFAMTAAARKSDTALPMLLVSLAGGRSFRVGHGQVLLKKGMQEVRASELQPGDELESVFTFPEGYVYRTDDGAEVTSTGAARVETVEPAGLAEAYSFQINGSDRFAFSAGVLGKTR